MNIRIGIVEDQIKIIERLTARLQFFDEIEIVMVARNGMDALNQLDQFSNNTLPQVLLMDIEMPGKSGIETTMMVKAKYPDIEILIQTVFENDEKIFKSIHAGASGYLLKDDPIQKYVESIRELVGGGAALSPTIAAKVMGFVQQTQLQESEKARKSIEAFALTDRELDILQAIVDDLTDDQIADRYFISTHTVRTHIKNMYKKLHIHSRASAVRFAFTNGLAS